MVEPFALVLGLVLGALKTGLGTPLCPLLDNQLRKKLLVLLFKCAQGLVSLSAEVSLNPSLIPSVPDPLLSYNNFLDSLHINNTGVRLKKFK